MLEFRRARLEALFGTSKQGQEIQYMHLSCCDVARKALFTNDFSHLHYNVIERGYETISAKNYKICPELPRIAIVVWVDYIVMQMRKVNSEKGYFLFLFFVCLFVFFLF